MKKQWDLTELEIVELTVRQEQKIGRVRLLEALQWQLGIEAKADSAWWEELVLRNKIPKQFRYRLVADEKLGKVWVKGEVEELDEKMIPQRDNPYT